MTPGKSGPGDPDMNVRKGLVVLAMAAAWIPLGCGRAGGATVPASAERAVAGGPSRIGALVPDVTVQTANGKSVSLAELTRNRRTVLVLYRGGWCVFCNRHLAELRDLHPKLTELGYQLLAVSPDRPAKLHQSVAKHNLPYTLLSDSNLAVARALGVAFRVDDVTVVRYKADYQIDLEAASGQDHHMLPVPAVFLIGRDGRIRFEHVDADYRRRIAAKRLMAAAGE